MENENKTPAKHPYKKNHHQKHKGYFIEPPTSQEKTEDPSTPVAQKDNNKGQNADGHKKKNHHKRHNNKGGDRHGNAPEAQAAQPQQTQPVSEKKDNERSTPEENGKKNNKNRHNRNRNRHRSEQGQTADATLQGAASQDKDPSGKKSNLSSNADNLKHTRNSPLEINEEEYEQISFPSAHDDNTTGEAIEEEPAVMVEVVGIRFKSSGKVYYFAPNGNKLRRGEFAIVETARGLEYGEVAMGNKEIKESDTVSPLRPIVRPATEADKQHHKDNKLKEEEAFRACNEKILAHGLDMKLIDAQYTFDNSKLLFYFTSAGRVDFRDLVKDLASLFRTRIELRQIGIRDEAKLMGGMGMCGRPLCCSLFLTDFGQVSIKMAKEQNLSLNSAKISGICGRLMCCLRYEHETYEYEIKRTPPVDSLVRTPDGNGVVTEISPLVGTVKVRLASSPDTPPKTYKREDVVMLQKKQHGDTKENV